VRVVIEAVEETQQRLVQHRVVADRAVELLQLRGARQVAVHQQVRHLEEARLLGELLDRVAAVKQDPGVAVYEGDPALAGGRRHEPRVEREYPEVLVQGREAEAIGAEAARACLQH
jgi:hypothetical protein